MPDTQLAGFSDCSDGRTGAVSRRSEPAAIGRALRAGVADRSEHAPHLRDRLIRSDAGRRILTGDGEGALAGLRVGAVLHPSGCIHCYVVISRSLSE